MIQAKNITFSHTGEPLYEKASFSVAKNKKVGLVGLNGSGKSTLFGLILREDWPEDGKLIVEGKVMLVPQEVKNDPLQNKSNSVRDYLLKSRSNSDAVLESLLAKMEMGRVCLNDSPKKLSGGQKTKLAILHAVLAEPDILLLDEPTNFLDTAGKKWVMHWLSGYKKTLIVVSHDLELLNQHIDKVIYINKQTKKFEEYSGNYSAFKRLKSDRDEHLKRYIANQENKIRRMKKSVEGLRSKTSIKGVRQRVNLERRLNRIEDKLPEAPAEIVRIKLKLAEPKAIGELPVRVIDAAKSYGEKQVLESVNFSIIRGQRVALIGQNGAGKTTLVKAAMGLVKLDSGTIEVDENADIGYYSQEFESFDMSQSLIDTVMEKTLATEGQARGFLAKFMFGADKVRQRVGTLSGGEKTRLSIALLMLKNHNFLILDEPTTYLDVLSQRIILEALKEYKGTMLVVSHTPDFLAELKMDRALLLPEEKLVYWDNNLLERSAEM